MITVKELTSRDSKDWDNLVENSNNGTIFHKMKFLSYHAKGKFNLTYLGFYKNNKLIAVISGEIKNNIFKSPVGASYGSFVAKDFRYDEMKQIVEKFLEFCKKEKIKQAFLTPSPIVYQKIQSQTFDFLFLSKGFRINRALITSIVDVSFLSPDVISNMRVKRRQIKKSINSGVKVTITKDVKSFYPILLKNKKKFGVYPTHTLEELSKLQQLFPDKIKLFTAFMGSEILAGVLIFICNANVVLAFYIAQNYKFQRYRSVSRLLYEVIRWTKENGYGYCDLGVNNDTSSSNPMEQIKSLINFKESFRSIGFLRITYHKIL